MTVLYFDCFSGAGGDMLVGALIDAGVSIDHLAAELAHLHLSGYRVRADKVRKQGFAASFPRRRESSSGATCPEHETGFPPTRERRGALAVPPRGQVPKVPCTRPSPHPGNAVDLRRYCSVP